MARNMYTIHSVTCFQQDSALRSPNSKQKMYVCCIRIDGTNTRSLPMAIICTHSTPSGYLASLIEAPVNTENVSVDSEAFVVM